MILNNKDLILQAFELQWMPESDRTASKTEDETWVSKGSLLGIVFFQLRGGRMLD